MHWLNYHHLHYFWMVVREGSITAAAEKLFVSQPTVSGQLRELERAVGEKLYERTKRDLRLTQTGRLVFEYADEIFTTGQELMDRLRGASGSRSAPFAIGIPDVMPKLVAARLIEPAFQLAERVPVICREAKLSELLIDLALNRLDIVLSDSQVGSQASIRAFNHPLGECGIALMCAPELRRQLRAEFPGNLATVPFILPMEGTVLRRAVAQWLRSHSVSPRLVAEIEDSALMKVLAGRGLGVIPVPSAVKEDAAAQFGLQVLAELPEIRVQFFAITMDRKVTHPTARVVLDAASQCIFRDSAAANKAD